MIMAAKTPYTKNSMRPWAPRHFLCALSQLGEKPCGTGSGLIRRFFPKDTNFHKLGHGEINHVEKLLNNRPRKCLPYRTPYEVFREARGALHC